MCARRVLHLVALRSPSFHPPFSAQTTDTPTRVCESGSGRTFLV